MSFTSKLKTSKQDKFEVERALIVKTLPSKPEFDRIYLEDAQGNRTRVFLKDGEAMPEGATRVTCVGVIMRPQQGTDTNGNYVFADEAVTAYVPRTGFKNWIENIQTQSYKGQIGAVAVIEGAVATSEHAIGDLKVGDEYAVVTGITYTDENKAIAMANVVSNGGQFNF